MVVVVPARDEGPRIARTVRALCEQREASGEALTPDRYEIVVIANNCRDDTAARARAAVRPGAPVQVLEVALPDPEAHVVGARRYAMDEAARRLRALGSGLGGGLIVSTDADSVPEPGWLAALHAEARAGAEVIGGRILLLPEERAALPAPLRRVHLQDTGYRWLAARLQSRLAPDPHDPWPHHHQHFGANLALTLEAYEAVGGLPDVPALEDVALVQALRRLDARLRHSPAARVHTSARTGGRVQTGLSTQLQEWAARPAHTDSD